MMGEPAVAQNRSPDVSLIRRFAILLNPLRAGERWLDWREWVR